VTNHRDPGAPIRPAADADVQEFALDALRRSLDDRLAALREPGAGDRLRALIDEPTRLGGVVKAGESH
jgi:hypothetical protein